MTRCVVLFPSSTLTTDDGRFEQIILSFAAANRAIVPTLVPAWIRRWLGNWVVRVIGRPRAVVVHHRNADAATALRRFTRQGASPGDIAMARRVERVFAFGEIPFVAVEHFFERIVIAGDIVFAAREPLLRDAQLVHQVETKVMLLAGEVHRFPARTEFLRRFPTDLAAQTGFVAGAFERTGRVHEIEQDGLEKVPVFGATGEQGAKPMFVALFLVDINDGQITRATGGDVEAEPERRRAVDGIEIQRWKLLAQERFDVVFAFARARRIERTELLLDFVRFEMNTLDLVIVTATFDGTPLNDVIGGRPERIAHVGLLEHFLIARACFAIGQELIRSKLSPARFVDDFDEAVADGVLDGDFVVEVPGDVWAHIGARTALSARVRRRRSSGTFDSVRCSRN